MAVSTQRAARRRGRCAAARGRPPRRSSRPQVIVPRARRDTDSPEVPIRRWRMVPYGSPPAPRSRGAPAASLAPMELGVNLGYLGMGVRPGQRGRRAGGRPPRVRRGVGRGGLRLGRPRPCSSWIGALTERIDLGRRRHADPGAHAGDDGDDRRHPRHPLRGASGWGSACQRSAGERGLARRAVRRTARAHPRVRRHRRGWRCAARAVALRRASTSRCPCPTAPARPSSSPSTRRDPTCRSTSPRWARRTSSSPARSPTGGSPSSSAPSTPATWSQSVRGRRADGPGAAPTTTRSTGFDIAPSVPVVIADDVEAAADADPPLRGALHRRHGLAGAELLQPARRADGLRGGRGRRCRTFPRQAAPRRRGGRAARVHRRHRRCIGPRDRIRRPAVAATPTRAWASLSIAPFAGGLEDRLHVVRTMAELMGETGL